jgi:hypothetical protein
MTVELKSQIEAYARWMEDVAGVPLRKPIDSAARTVFACTSESADDFELVSTRPGRGRPFRTLALVAAAVVTLVGSGLIATRLRRITPTLSAGTNGNARTEVTWYGLGADNPLNRSDVKTNDDGQLLCRQRDNQGGCSELAGSFVASYAGSNVTITTEYAPADSSAWQMLNLLAERLDISGRPGFVIRDGAIAGFEPMPGVHVVVTAPAGSEYAQILRSLERRSAVVDLPVVFGESTATDAKFPNNGEVGRRYFAGYVDATNRCIGGVGVPWNNEQSCAAAKPDTLRVMIASPSPAGTIVVAVVPNAAARVEASLAGNDPHILPIVDASAGFRVVFADLDAFAPDTLTAFDSAGVAIGSTPIVSTGGAPLGYLPPDVVSENGTGPGLTASAGEMTNVVRRLGAGVPLPPGVSLDDIAAKLLPDFNGAESTMVAIIEYNAACRWTTYWLDSNARGDAVAKRDAQSHLDGLTARAALLVGDKDGGVVGMWRKIAAAARAGNPNAVNDAGYRVNCTDASLQQPAR